jgi:subtilisin-like proprotein convertase family protein
MSRSTVMRFVALASLVAAVAIAGGSGNAASKVAYMGGSIAFTDCCNNAGALTGPPSYTPASYPSNVTVSGFSGTVGHLSATVVLDAVYPDDIQLLLVGPGNQKVLLMANAGGDAGNGVTPDTLVFDDGAAAGIPEPGQLKSGTYKPTALSDVGDCDNQTTPNPTTTNFPGGAPAQPYGTLLSAFNGSSPNGVWKLYAIDDCNLANAGGSITSWQLDITGPTGVSVKSFTAQRAGKGVQLRWRTANETEAFGFNVFRTKAGKLSKVNQKLIRAKRAGRPQGASYSLRDSRVSSSYRLQAVSPSGKRFWAATTAVRASK